MFKGRGLHTVELVYLWVKEYKNIRNQGFNFSPRFTCKYEDGKLTIDKKEHVSIFPENINVTAIVGENGSGKSSVLLGLTNNKIVIERNNTLFSNDFKGEFDKLDRREDYEIIYVDFDLIKINQIEDFWDYSALNIYDKNLYKIVENGLSGDVNINIAKFRENFYNLIIEYIGSFKSGLFFFNPIEISLEDYLHPISEKSDKSKFINKLIAEVKNNNFSKEKFLVFLYSNIMMRVPPNLKEVEEIKEIILIEDEILKDAEYFKIENIEEIYDLFDALIEYKQKPKIKIEKFSVIYNKHKKAFLKLIEIGYLQIELKDFKNREYFSLSQGERKLFTEFLMIFDAIKKTDKDDIFIVLDEPDLTLHPQWQKNYIKELISLLSNFPTKKFHIIITSHSPFILSDLPKENVIFLEKGKQVYPKIETFGANIHTLLSNGFFMKDGLMGEFAKEKITEILDYLNDKTDLKTIKENQVKPIIEKIGEEFLREKLLRMYDKKFPISKEEKIQQLEAEIKRLKNG